MNRFIWLCFFFGICLLTGCYHSPEVMTAADGKPDGQNMQSGQEKTDISDGQSLDLESGTMYSQTDAENTGQIIYVYVCGQVNQPGVYALSADARICDALEMAGGVTEDGKPEALNQAEHVSDGQTLYVPGKDETVTEQAEAEDGLIDINGAGRELLMSLPGIGESKADMIITYREEHGSFASIEEIMDIPGIKEGVFNKIKDKIKCK